MPKLIADTWFDAVFGIKEPRPFEACRDAFELHEGPAGDDLPPAVGPAYSVSARSGPKAGDLHHVGPFQDPTVAELRARVAAFEPEATEGFAYRGSAGATFTNVLGDARELHLAAANAGAVFQVASQFNCLEMISPSEQPESGVTNYFRDHTQGPACAMACPAGTLFRNYLLRVGTGPRGQAGGSDAQLNCARDLAAAVGNEAHKYLKLQNGYLLPTEGAESLRALGARLESEAGLADAARSALRVGVHWDTATSSKSGHRVAQVFSSAVPVSYARSTSSGDWAPLANVVLEGTFEATLLVAAALAQARGSRVAVFLSGVGGGAFGNRSLWIRAAVTRALEACRHYPIDVKLVHWQPGVGASRASAGTPEWQEVETAFGRPGPAGPKPPVRPPMAAGLLGALKKRG